MPYPDYYLPIMPYLVLENAGQFIEFAKLVFGASERFNYPAPDGGIMHAEVSIGAATLMVADSGETHPPFPACLFLLIENIDDVYARALAHGALSLRAPEQQDYGYSAGFKDAYGNQWWITEAGS